jgi:capsular polysaccharide biosynthesis protein
MMCKLVHIQRWIKANQEEAEKQADTFATSTSKKMINIMHVDDEESLYQGIENMMHALGNESDPPIEMKKLQTAPNYSRT